TCALPIWIVKWQQCNSQSGGTGMATGPFDSSGVARAADGGKYFAERPATLVDMLRISVERDPEGEALVEVDGDRVSYRMLWNRAARVAAGLRKAGLQPGDRAAILLGNGIDWVLAFWGCQFAGVVAVPVNTRLAEEEARYIIEDSGAKWVFRPGEPLPDDEPDDPADRSASDLAAIFYTSGTTGRPKGAMTTHANFLSNTETARRVMGKPKVDRNGRNLVSVPLFHVTGCNSQLLPSLEMGGTTVIMPEFNVQRFLATFE